MITVNPTKSPGPMQDPWGRHNRSVAILLVTMTESGCITRLLLLLHHNNNKCIVGLFITRRINKRGKVENLGPSLVRSHASHSLPPFSEASGPAQLSRSRSTHTRCIILSLNSIEYKLYFYVILLCNRRLKIDSKQNTLTSTIPLSFFNNSS